jgi:anti-anti-sigma factor
MQISVEEMEGGITRVILDGRMDIEGAARVDLKLNVVAGSSRFLIFDMQKVSFLGSMGLRSVVVPAQVVHRRGGKAVIFAPTPMVEAVFKTSGIDTLIPIHHEIGSALAALQ